MSFLKRMETEVLIADGAMGTLLYSYGTDSCFEELNLSAPSQIENIHRAYIQAGADLIQTNTYAANYLKLKRYGLEDSVKEINSAGVKIARSVVQSGTYILGTIGGIRGIKPLTISLEEIKRSFREQLYCLLLAEVDGLLLETFYDLEELETVLMIARKETDLPIITQISLQEIGILQDQTPIDESFLRLEEKGANIVGLNCRLGPHHMLETLSRVALPKHAYLSAYPNASLPSYIDGKIQYEEDENYFKKSARPFLEQGIRLIGGCCGTTPNHIKAFADEIRHAAPVLSKTVKQPSVKKAVETITISRTEKPIQDLVKNNRAIIVELDPPKQLTTEKFFNGAKALKAAGIDALTLADNSLATPRIANEALAHLVNKKIGIRPLVHISCRDRNLIGLQSHLMGLHTLGLHDILAITGDPARVGNFPGASSVFDLSSFELIEMIKQFNDGLSPTGKELGQKAIFSVGAAFNPHVRYLEKAVARLEKKIQFGADYFISQPVFSEEQLINIHKKTKHLSVPIYIGIMPLISSKNAEYLHSEVPGIKIADHIRQQMAAVSHDPIQAELEGLTIAKSLIDTAMDLFNGIYLVTPFLRYSLTAELTKYIRQKDKQKESQYAEAEFQ
ncbi:methionine synthase / methylenetetrahydrofolate reductase (NADH) [Cytobacillus horneckiae]|uniref:bifunctional homocysteine S-methyltransferase/methylenetetrahydrofolate reductase n=1 Tax=Cytobacillus horneckiae TaxID=549687 RepID=UPI0019D20C39|nr:bifunctional homocysteine S-methyltransferase/methylenetetrahydrofolate reductase [Cytobacillus horneckiae]MBN6889666.1 bifunctional homocysteine S-methyltransferase/methylenetetrahydrofolate reductase [Cytobacillus horneckiae]